MREDRHDTHHRGHLVIFSLFFPFLVSNATSTLHLRRSKFPCKFLRGIKSTFPRSTSHRWNVVFIKFLNSRCVSISKNTISPKYLEHLRRCEVSSETSDFCEYNWIQMSRTQRTYWQFDSLLNVTVLRSLHGFETICLSRERGAGSTKFQSNVKIGVPRHGTLFLEPSNHEFVESSTFQRRVVALNSTS